MSMVKVPEAYKAVINMAIKENGVDFYTDGGCGLLAALLAEVAIKNGGHGLFNLIMRGDFEGDRWLSHVTFDQSHSDLDLDVGGDDASYRWVERILKEEEEENGTDPDDVEFDDEIIAFGPGDDIKSILWKITEDYDLAVNVEWLEEHYDRLKARALKIADKAMKKSSEFSPG